MRIRTNRKDIIWSYIAVLLSVGTGIIIIPLVLKFLTDEHTAVYYIFTSLSGITSLFDFGFTPSIARSMAYAWSGNQNLKQEGADKSSTNGANYTLIKKIILTCKVLYSALATAALILCLTLGTLYIQKITYAIDDHGILVSWVIYSLAIATNLLYGYYSVYLRGVGAITQVSKAIVYAKAVQIILAIVLLINGLGLLGISIAYLAYGFIFRMFSKRFFFSYNKMSESLNRNSYIAHVRDIKDILNVIWPNTWRDGLVSISNYLSGQALTILASFYLSLQDTGIYSLSVQLVSVIAMVASTTYSTYQPLLQSAYANRDIDMQRNGVSAIVVSLFILYLAGMIALLTIGIPIVGWLKPSYELSRYLLLAIGVYQFLISYRNCYTSYISTTNRMIYAKYFLASSVLGVVLSLVLVKEFNLGVYGLTIGQLLSQLFNVFYWPRMVHNELRLKPNTIFILGIRELLNTMVKNRSNEQ